MPESAAHVDVVTFSVRSWTMHTPEPGDDGGALIASVLKDFGVSTGTSEPFNDARSGAGITRVRTADGRPAYLKTTPAELGARAVQAARRELAFYRDLAPAVPVRTPELLRSHETDRGIALLLTDMGCVVPAASWHRSWWAKLGQHLAALHSIDLPDAPLWERPDPLQAAMNAPDIGGIEAFWTPSLPGLAALLNATADLVAQLSTLPLAFTHGDCHTGNVVLAEDRLSFCDWQAAGIGRPVADLAFLSVRATPSGVVVPPDLVVTYAAHRSLDPAELRSVLIAEELAVLIFLWPPFAAHNSRAGVARIRSRARDLAQQWGRGRG
jgi:Ser/Thr protein kinase RdoA (MazF antagonist)